MKILINTLLNQNEFDRLLDTFQGQGKRKHLKERQNCNPI